MRVRDGRGEVVAQDGPPRLSPEVLPRPLLRQGLHFLVDALDVLHHGLTEGLDALGRVGAHLPGVLEDPVLGFERDHGLHGVT